jgi:hypothetical protein
MSADSDMVMRAARGIARKFSGGKSENPNGAEIAAARAALDASGIGELVEALDRGAEALSYALELLEDLDECPAPIKWCNALDGMNAALSRARATAEKGGAPDCPFCSGRSTFSGDPARSFCDEHYRQYLLTFQIVAKDLAAYRARATQETNSE